MKRGILGGTFDPVHRGHLMLAEEAKKRLDLDEVLFIPTSVTPLKEDADVSSVEHRVQMILLAIADYPAYRLSRIEIDRAGISYTVDTIEQLRSESAEEDELFLIIGVDSLKTLPRWKEPERLIRMCRLVAIRRPGYPLSELADIEKAVPGLSDSLILCDKPEVDISATEIRERVAAGLPVNHLVPGPVEEYIREHKLYR